MTDSKRKLKQAFFAIIFLALTVGPIIYYYFSGFGRFSCFNNVWDIDEEGVDCGGQCGACFSDLPPAGVSNFKQIQAIIIPTSKKGFDLVAEVENPNEDWGAESLDYRFTLFDDNNNALTYIEGTDFIMPGASRNKYIIRHSEDLGVTPSYAKITLTNIKWKKFPSYLKKPDFSISYKSFTDSNNRVKASGELNNLSINGFNQVYVSVIARGRNNKIIGAATTDMSTLKSEEKRYFEFAWDNRFEEQINENKVEWNVQVNILQDDNFMEKIYDPVREGL